MSLLDSWGVKPSAVCGHSSGEIAAAYAAGLLDLPASIAVAYYRGKAATEIQNTHRNGGSMMAVGAGPEEVEGLLGSLVNGMAMIACYNSPNSVTVSGDVAAIRELQPMLDKLGIFYRLLKVDVAYHSDHMRSVGYTYLENITALLHKNSSTAKQVKFFSSVNGMAVGPKVVKSPWYWLANLICPVQFDAVLRTMTSLPKEEAGNRAAILAEIGPHSALKGPIRQIMQDLQPDIEDETIEYTSALKRGEDSSQSVLTMIASLVNRGFPVNYSAVASGEAKFGNLAPITDLPSYCFNKTKRYWQSSRTIEEYAHGNSPWNVLLGHRITSSVGASLEFRNVFKLDDIPWLRDHQINGEVVFPMAGYLSMAIEAVRFSPHHQSQTIKGYRLREIALDRAFILSEDTTHEIFTILKPQLQSTRSSSSDGWFTFQILSWGESSGFSEHCRGHISVDFKPAQAPFAEDSVHLLWELSDDKLKSQAYTSLHNEITPHSLYEKASSEGIHYGSAFRLLSRLRTGKHLAVGTVACDDSRNSMPLQYQNALVAHPTILDAAFHVGLCNIGGNDGNLQRLSAFMPKAAEEVYVSNHTSLETGSNVEVLFHDAKTDRITRTTSANLTCFANGSKLPVLRCRNVKLFEMGNTDSKECEVNDLNPMKIDWHKDLSLLPSGYLGDYASRSSLAPAELHELRNLEQASYYFIEQSLSVPISTPNKEHLRKLQRWMEHTVTEVKSSKPNTAQHQWLKLNRIERQQFIRKACLNTTQGEWTANVGPRLSDILSEAVDPLSILLHDGLLWRIYDDSYLFRRSFKQLAEIVGLLSHQNPCLRILEVGAGTGGCTARVLEELTSIPSLGLRFQTYDYTDISTAFFEGAAEKFQAYKGHLNFKRFDLSQDPEQQGFIPASYDLVIAADVIHATPDMAQSLRHIRKVLKPDGVLAMVELARMNPLMFPFATLPGFWFREDGPIVPRSEWNDLLLHSGFTGLEDAVDDFPGWPVHSTLLSRATYNPPPFQLPVTVVSDLSPPGWLMENLKQLITTAGGQFIGQQPLTDTSPGNGLYVCLDEIWNPFLASASQEHFDHLRSLVCTARGILWVTREPRPNDPEEPALDFAFGFSRALRLENAGLKFVVLQLEDDKDTLPMTAIVDVFEHAFIRKHGSLETDVDYKVVGGHVHVPRVVPDDGMRNCIERETTDLPVDGERLWQAEYSHRLALDNVGLLNTLHFQQHRLMDEAQALKPDEVLIEVRAAGLNFKDVLVALGSVPWEPLGKECSGVVISAGNAARAEYKKGDSVVAWGEDMLSTHVRCNVRHVVKMPSVESLDYAEATSIPIVFGTAYESLVNVARLKRGEKLLVHAAAGGVGQAAITVAQWIGAEIFCTVGTVEKKNLIMHTYGIPETHIYSSRSSAFAEGVKLTTASYGVDVVINSLTGERLRESWQCLAPFGRFIDIGKRSFLENSLLEMGPFNEALSFHAVDLAMLIRHRSEHMHHVMSKVMEHFESGAFHLPEPIQTIPVSDIESAMRTMQAGKHVGKLVVMFNDDHALVKARRSPATTNAIRQDASYIITGGAGGIGRSLARWLITQGAKNIILATRRGNDGVIGANIRELQELSKANNCNVRFIKCDVGSPTDVRRMVDAVPHNMPVRGVIHGAMVLKVRPTQVVPICFSI